jgi:YD repeat-containing protein
MGETIKSCSNVMYTQQWDAEHRLTQVTNTSVTPNRVTKFYYNPSVSLRTVTRQPAYPAWYNPRPK